MTTPPPVIIHMDDHYDPGIGGGKWKSRFMTSARTMAQGLIQYLTWPGDQSRFTAYKATTMGEFNVYRYDEEATYKLRQEMAKLNPKDRWAKTNKNAYHRSMDKTFVRNLTALIERTTGAR